MANHCRSLQQVFGLRGQPVEARGQHGLDGGGHLHGDEGLRQAIGPWFTNKPLRLDQRPDALFQEEGIALGAPNEESLQRPQARVVTEEGLQEFVSTARRQWIESHLRVVSFAAPAVLVFGAIGDQHQQPRPRQALDQGIE